MSETINGAEALVRSIIAEGVETIFGYPGGAIMPVYDRLFFHSEELRHILVRHEQGAAHAAQGFARATGRPGVVIVTSGPAATNVITGLSDALMDSTPLVVITGQVSSGLLGSDAFQETDVVGIVHPVTKWAIQIRDAADIAPAVARAFYIATTGRPGPVVIDIAKDAQMGLTEWHEYKRCDYIRSYHPVPDIDMAAVKQIASMLNVAARPMILAGQGVTLSGAEERLCQLAEKGDIPVANTLLGLSTIPSDHRLNVGLLGMHGNIGPNYNTNRADLILAIGMRFDDRVTGELAGYAKQAKIVHIDIDRSELNKNVRADIALHGDARQVIEALLPYINSASHTAWLDEFDRCDRVEQTEVIQPEVNPTDGLLKQGEVITRVARAFDNEAIGVTDVGQNQMFGARYFTYRHPRSFITSGGLGTMGFGLPAAIGAKIGCPERQVVLFVGDGGFQMTIQELGTIMEYDVPVKIVILNNSFLGNVRQWQQLFFGGRFSATPLLNPDFVSIGQAYGIAGENVTDRSQLNAALERLVKSDRAYLLNVTVDPEDMIFPMIPLGANVDTIMLDAERIFD